MMIVIKISRFIGDTSMKRPMVLIILALFLVSMMSSTASAAILGTWVPSLSTTRIGTASGSFSSVIDAVFKFEGTLQAYSSSQANPKLEEQLTLASEDLITSAESLDAELTEIYSSLSPEQQSAILEIYSSLDSFFEELDVKTDQISKELDRQILDGIDFGGMFENFDLT
jgi:cell shape-determining protein MreC